MVLHMESSPPPPTARVGVNPLRAVENTVCTESRRTAVSMQMPSGTCWRRRVRCFSRQLRRRKTTWRTSFLASPWQGLWSRCRYGCSELRLDDSSGSTVFA